MNKVITITVDDDSIDTEAIIKDLRDMFQDYNEGEIRLTLTVDELEIKS